MVGVSRGRSLVRLELLGWARQDWSSSAFRDAYNRTGVSR